MNINEMISKTLLLLIVVSFPIAMTSIHYLMCEVCG